MRSKAPPSHSYQIPKERSITLLFTNEIEITKIFCGCRLRVCIRGTGAESRRFCQREGDHPLVDPVREMT
jgi:hypothetical protein